MRQIIDTPNQILNSIFLKAARLRELDNYLHEFLDPEVAEHCRVANLDKGQLTIETDSAAWATHLRFQRMELLNRFRTEGKLHGLRSIKHYVRPNALNPAQPPRRQLHLSASSAEQITKSANQIKHKALHDALQRLASNC